MKDWFRRKLLLGGALMLVGAGLSACDSPTATRSIEGPSALATTTEQTSVVAVADSDTTALFNTDCSINNGCATTDSVTVAEPGGNVKIGTYGAPWVTTITVGTDTYKFQLGLINGSFIGIIFKNGTFVGYWGYCLFPNAQNNWYKTTDPATGKVYIHWENHELDSNRNDTGQMYHYIYDPQTGTLKVYHRKKDGTTILVYQGPPIKSHGKLPPPDPTGTGPYTNENQWTTGVPVPAVPTGTTTGTTSPSTGTATPTTGSMSVGMSDAGALVAP